MNTVAMIATFVIIAAALYGFLSLVIKRMDARYERHSTQVRRKNTR
jgi:hypothetical protein